jgi:glutamate synthase domain-containing protein 2
VLRFYLLGTLVVLGALTSLAAIIGGPGWWVLLGLLVLLLVVGVHDLVQKKHSILRNYPILGHMRFLLESIRPEMQQYFIERNFDGRPYDRDTRTSIYTRAKGTNEEQPFGTERDVNEIGYEYLVHSTVPVEVAKEEPRVRVGGPDCTQPYDMALLNVSAMSFGALSANALTALNAGAAKGGFAHDTGEGGISKYHRQGGDLVWEIGSGYFGARTDDGRFDEDKFRDQAADDQIKLVSLKLSQGAKPGIGGVLPGAKVTQEIADARGVPKGEKCVSPSYHRVFSTPRELVTFIARMRDLSGGKPAGFKLCVGSRVDVLGICKAMVAEGITPDFIIVDGAEGGTGAAPMEYEDHIGTPLTEGLATVHNALVGVGLRQRQGRHWRRYRQADRAGCGLHQRGPSDDDGGRLHPGADLPHQHLPRRGRDPGPEADARPGHPRQDRAGLPLPARDRQAGDAGDRVDGPRRPPRARPAHASPPRRPQPHAELRRGVPTSRDR